MPDRSLKLHDKGADVIALPPRAMGLRGKARESQV